MEIHLVSSLTPDDERRLAPAMLAAIGRVLDRLPVTYSVRVETAIGNAIQQNRAAPPLPVDAPDTLIEDSAFDPIDRLPAPGGRRIILDRD